MYGDIGGVQVDYPVQTAAEAVHGIRWQACNQVHVDVPEACIHRLAVGAKDIFGLVWPPAGPEYGIFHGLGVDAHPVCAVVKDGLQLFRIQGIGSAAFYGEFQAAGQIEAVPDGVQKPGHLGACQGRGGAAAHVEAAYCPSGLPEKRAGALNFLQQCLQIGLHQLGFLANRAADKAAIGTAGGAEGNAHIDADIGGLGFVHSLHGGDRAVHCQASPLGCDEVYIF